MNKQIALLLLDACEDVFVSVKWYKFKIQGTY